MAEQQKMVPEVNGEIVQMLEQKVQTGKLKPEWEKCPWQYKHLRQRVIIHPDLGQHCRWWHPLDVQSVLDYIIRQRPRDLLVYTNSSLQKAAGGWSFIVLKDRAILRERNGHVMAEDLCMKTLDVLAVTQAFFWLCRESGLNNTTVYIITDRLDLLVQVKIGRFVKEWIDLAPCLKVKQILWVYCPAHSGIRPNIRAYHLSQMARHSAMPVERALEFGYKLEWERCPKQYKRLHQRVLIHPDLGQHCRKWLPEEVRSILDNTIGQGPGDLLVFTDGSFKKGVGGWAFVAMRNNATVHEMSGHIVKRRLRAGIVEELAVTQAFVWLSVQTGYHDTLVYVISDCKDLLDKVKLGGFLGQWIDLAPSLNVKQISWVYCPAHAGIEPNIRADQLAREARMAAMIDDAASTVSDSGSHCFPRQDLGLLSVEGSDDSGCSGRSSLEQSNKDTARWISGCPATTFSWATDPQPDGSILTKERYTYHLKCGPDTFEIPPSRTS